MPEIDAPSLQRAGTRLVNQGKLLRSQPPSFASAAEIMKATIPTQQIEAIVAVFDLAGFTSFCSQAHPATDIPTFLNDFLMWLFKKIEQGNAADDGITIEPLWKEPPLFAKFLGDGVLLLWDAGNMVDQQIAKLITILLDVCDTYCSEFYKKAGGYIKNPPQSLRCRIARGSVFSVNNGRDYVGHCINIATHLQEYKGFSFGIVSEGFNTTESLEASLRTQLVSLSLPVRRIRTNEPVWVLRREVESLPAGNSPV